MASKRAASPSVLSAAGFELIKQYPGEEQVRLKVVVEIPGSWFGSGVAGSLTANERAEKYRAQAVEFAAVHEFKKAGARKATKEPGMRFICIADAAEDANHPGFWMQLKQWNRYRHDTYKDKRDDELQFIVAPADQATAQTAAPRAAEPKPAIIDCFEVVSSGPHKQQLSGGGSKTVHCTWYRCVQPGCKRRKDRPIREVGKGTGQLFRELKTCNPGLWRKLRLESNHSKAVRGEDGELVELMSFKEALPHHIRFVKWCVKDWQPFSRSRSEGFRKFVRGLNPRAGLPHRETSIKLLGVLRTLTDQKVDRVISMQRLKFAEPFAGATSDVWSLANCRAAFFCMRLNMVLEPEIIFTVGGAGSSGKPRPTTLTECAPMVAFREFTETSHSGALQAPRPQPHPARHTSALRPTGRHLLVPLIR